MSGFRIIAALAWLGAMAYAQGDAYMEKEDMKAPRREFSPYANRGFPANVYFGDTHLHTSLSIDAGSFGNRLGMEQAYRFCRGEEVNSSGGFRARMGRPLDFVVIADHSDGMGFHAMLVRGDPIVMEQEVGRRWHKMINAGGQSAVEATLEMINLFSQGKIPWRLNDSKLMRPVWDSVVKVAEEYNEPGKFTALIGYEWTSLVKGNNLHRVVIYRDGGDRALRVLPFTNTDSSDPEELWKALAAYEQKTGGRVLAIPHNGNLSNGLMFDLQTLSGGAITKEYAQKRVHWERLCESTQIKGDGEAHPYLSPDDEFADYETWDLGNLDLSQAKTRDMLIGEYARSGLKRGLEFARKLGVNPCRGRELLRQALRGRAVARARGSRHPGRQGGQDLRLADGFLRLRRRLGLREHSRGTLRRHASPGDLRHDRLAHAGPLLRWLGLRTRRRAEPAARQGRIRQGRSDGR